MPLEPIIEEIVRKGHQQVAEIKSSAEEEAEKIILEAKENAKEILKRAREEAEKEAERLRRQEISSINLEMKKEELNRKREVVENVYQMLVEKVANLDGKEREELLKKLLSKYEGQDYVVYSNKKDEELVKKLTKLEYAGNVDCIGGVVLESKDGEFRINLTFDTLLQEVYESKMKDIYEKLFG
ncbi:Archaeal/vacuolar-type H+-ATPase subunit E [Geoglobus ahangari]|uniref:A-type ATP synthase subunit E n=1 Tax=Geoglobus ahangari TaxID=113653 RepID=A0A0F7DBV9_9EURY|nr:V-type ATP synthase subunit E [Geoglobus ahangari]AKG91771.1 Archaeal/vacuolar-type H+-ATPase subunit E [Geoglobus ahangari]